jgi:hypothetical protein
LTAVADYVHSWLFPPEKKEAKPGTIDKEAGPATVLDE